MNALVMYGSALVAVFVVGYMLIKKMDIKITLFTIGIILMYVAVFMGNDIAILDFQSTGMVWLDPLKAVIDQFKQMMPAAGFIIMILGGYSAYMSSIGANEVTVNVLTKPIAKIKSVYILVAIVFLLGNILSLVIPSASNLAIILLATLYPVLRKAGMSTLTAAAVIATTATVMPTPLGSDNVAIAEALAKSSEFAGITVTEYVFNYHAMVSIPTLLVMAIVHSFWQKFMDKKSKGKEVDTIEVQEVKEIKGGAFYKTVYTLLTVFPIILVVAVYLLDMFAGIKINLSVEVATIFSFILAVICELFRTKGDKKVLEQTEDFFKGMGNAFPIVALTVAASVFVVGLQSLGLISELQQMMLGMQGSGMGFVLPLILVVLSIAIVLLSGSGTSLFFAMVPLVVPLAAAAGISAIAISVPMGMAGNLIRAVSPVAAVVMIVAGSTKQNPLDIVKRTSVPMFAGTIFMFIMSMLMFL